MLYIIVLILALVTPQTPVITVSNVDDLRPVAAVDFESLPPEIVIQTGWFNLSTDGQRAAGVRADGGLMIWSLPDGALIDTFTVAADDGTPATVLDARFDASGERVATIHTADGQTYQVAVHRINGGTTVFDYPGGLGVPVRVWLDSDAPEVVWIEAGPDYFDPEQNRHLVVRLTIPGSDAEPAEPVVIDAAPEADSESFVRIGRIPAPLAITSTADGVVRLWDLQTGVKTAEVVLDAVPVFGRVNETTGQQLTWRDQTSQALHLLDFATGENRLIAEIGGEYIQALMLTPAADVVLAVHIGDVPNVAAWDASSGAFRELGLYREDCSRVPDMVQLSADGTTLVIGCDTGLEVWQVTAGQGD
jgi:WD40 repeat protein